MVVVEKEKEGEAKEAKVAKVVVAVACNNHAIRQITVVAERAIAERPNTLLHSPDLDASRSWCNDSKRNAY